MSDMNTARPRIPSLATAGIAVLSLNGETEVKGVIVTLDSKFRKHTNQDETGKRRGEGQIASQLTRAG